MLTETFGWQPAGTTPPDGWTGPERWSGRYDSNDNQGVTDADANKLAQSLHAAAVSDKIDVALTDVINHLETGARNAGVAFPIR